MQAANPYRPPDERAADKDVALKAESVPTSRVHFGRYIIAAIATASFFYFGYAFVHGMMNRAWWSALGFVTISLASIPWASTTTRLIDCLSGSLIMPLCVGVAATFAIGYFNLFHFDWFERIFNDKGVGPLGLFLSVALGFVAGGLLGSWLLSLFRLDSFQAARDAFGPDNVE